MRPSRTHLKPSKLFGVAEGSLDFAHDEREHLKTCEACRNVLAVFRTYVTEEENTA